MTGSGCVPRLHHRRRSGGLDQCPVRPRRGYSSGTIPCRRVLIEQWSERHASHAAPAVTYTGETCGVRLACAQHFRPKGPWTALYPTFLCSKDCSPRVPAGRSLNCDSSYSASPAKARVYGVHFKSIYPVPVFITFHHVGRQGPSVTE